MWCHIYRLICISSIFLFAACASPYSSARMAQEKQDFIARNGGIYYDAGVQAYVEDIAARIFAAAYAQGAIDTMPVTIKIVEQTAINATIWRDGDIYLTRGLLALCTSEDELAGVIGHELAHIAARHAEREEQAVILGDITYPVVNLEGDINMPDGGFGADIILNNGAAYETAQYRQEREYEADRMGIKFLAAAGYDPYAQAAFLAHLDAHKRLMTTISQRAVPRYDWFRSHPQTALRQRFAYDAAKQYKRPDTAQRAQNKQRYLNAIHGLAFGEKTQTGYQAHIHIYTVDEKDTVKRLAHVSNFVEHREDLFRMMNGLEAEDVLEAGQLVKLVRISKPRK